MNVARVGSGSRNPRTAATQNSPARCQKPGEPPAVHRQITGVFPGIACSAYRFQEWPTAQAPSRLALPPRPARLAQALARFWCPLSVMLIAVGWWRGGPPEPAYSTGMELDLTGASRAVTFAEKRRAGR